MISPLGGWAKRAATSSARPRTTSSKRFVSSRQTATARSGCAAASERNVAGNRCGDSNATTGKGQRCELVPELRQRPAAPRQEADELVTLARRKPLATSAVSTADGAGENRDRHAGVESGSNEPRARDR